MDYISIFFNVLVLESIRLTLGLFAFYIIFKLFKNWTRKNIVQKKQKRKKKLINSERINTLKTLLVFAAGGCLTGWGVGQGYFKFYITHEEYSIWYTIGSFFLLVILQDAYFYWTHRFLHTKFMFKLVHHIHHRSRKPALITSYSFGMLEALILYGVIPLYLLFLPLNVIVFQLFMVFMVLRDAQAHSGIESYPKWWVNSPLDKLTTVTHHDLHHQNVNGNYGLYFTFWDRLMKTEFKNYKEEFIKVKEGK